MGQKDSIQRGLCGGHGEAEEKVFEAKASTWGLSPAETVCCSRGTCLVDAWREPHPSAVRSAVLSECWKTAEPFGFEFFHCGSGGPLSVVYVTLIM